MFKFSKKGPMADTQLSYETTVGAGSSVTGTFTHRGNMLLSGHLVGDIHQDDEPLMRLMVLQQLSVKPVF